MKIQHVQLDVEHFLVVDGKRGPVCYIYSQPAYHPAGFIYFPRCKQVYSVPDYLRGRLFYDDSAPTLMDYAVEEVDASICEPANAAYAEWSSLMQTCRAIHEARYEEAPLPAKGEEDVPQ